MNKATQPISTWPVITETGYLLQSRLGLQQVCEFLDSSHAGLFVIYGLGPEQLLCMIELMQKDADLPMDLADASLVVLAEALGQSCEVVHEMATGDVIRRSFGILG